MIPTLIRQTIFLTGFLLVSMSRSEAQGELLVDQDITVARFSEEVFTFWFEAQDTFRLDITPEGNNYLSWVTINDSRGKVLDKYRLAEHIYGRSFVVNKSENISVLLQNATIIPRKLHISVSRSRPVRYKDTLVIDTIAMLDTLYQTRYDTFTEVLLDTVFRISQMLNLASKPRVAMELPFPLETGYEVFWWISAGDKPMQAYNQMVAKPTWAMKLAGVQDPLLAYAREIITMPPTPQESALTDIYFTTEEDAQHFLHASKFTDIHPAPGSPYGWFEVSSLKTHPVWICLGSRDRVSPLYVAVKLRGRRITAETEMKKIEHLRIRERILVVPVQNSN